MKNNGKYDVVFVGTAIVDSIIKGFDPKPVSAAGFKAASGTLHAGGEAVNASVAAAKLGAKCAAFCHLGTDAAGGIIENELSKYGVDTSLIVHSEEHATPVTTMFVNDDGTRKSITNAAHRYNFHPEKDLFYLENTRAVVIGSLFRAPFDDPEIIYSVFKNAKEKGIYVFADTKLPNFNILSLDDISKALPYIDYITPNEDEAKYYTGSDDPEKAADVFLKYGVKNVIIKLGSRGCFMKNAHGSLYIPALDINAMDATGAGDNFLAGFVCEILSGKSDEEALRFANACGAICATAPGAGTALVNREQVERLLA